MAIAGMALAILGYALLYSGASNMLTGGNGWGFLQALLNKGTPNATLGSQSGGYLLGKVDTNQAGGVIGPAL